MTQAGELPKQELPKQEGPKPRARRHAATLADVGRAAGVSAMAASAVLNGAVTSSRISKETRERILAAAAQLRYRANATARGLVLRRMDTIGVATTLSRNELNQYFLEVFNGVIEAAAEAGQNTTVFALNDWPSAAQRMAQICDGRIDGLILLAPLLDSSAAEWLPDHTPLVSVHGNAPLPGVLNIESDEEAGAYAMTQQLLALGHRHVLHIGGQADAVGAQRRANGLRRAHAEAGLELRPDHLLHAGFSAEAARRELQAWLQRHSGETLPTALFAGSDAMALACIDMLNESGLQVPQDLSVVGFDDTLLARSAHLATVRQPLREMGHRAVRALVARIDAKQAGLPAPASDTIVLPTAVVAGHTLAPPRSHAVLIP